MFSFKNVFSFKKKECLNVLFLKERMLLLRERTTIQNRESKRESLKEFENDQLALLRLGGRATFTRSWLSILSEPFIYVFLYFQFLNGDEQIPMSRCKDALLLLNFTVIETLAPPCHAWVEVFNANFNFFSKVLCHASALLPSLIN